MKDGFVARPLCPFCRAEWTDEMIQIETYAGRCDSCDFGSGTVIEIICHSCKKLIYKKDTR